MKKSNEKGHVHATFLWKNGWVADLGVGASGTSA